ncbi:carboxypeptidase Taq [Geomicrobium halophilum]|uniref:Metal-dependent carboxypeptidase n=1 Tax=Geomicrobium halophilum TaxID=549000 RepID=A0A841PTX4_9BACL|nr:hypothetical protein [Geomicrobium halophilum]MBB6451224.1 carboxypeptidase Taq [Geomicrobium halophilum]
MSKQSNHEELIYFLHRMAAYEQALSLMEWDAHTMGSKNSLKTRTNAIEVLTSEIYNILTSPETEELLEANDPTTLPAPEKSALLHLQTHTKRLRNIPFKDYQAYKTQAAKAASAWSDARKKNDFSVFRPQFDKLVAWQHEFANMQGYEEHPYDAILANHHYKMTVKAMDQLFSNMKDTIHPLMERIKHSEHRVKTGFQYYTIPDDQQAFIANDILKEIGFNFNSGRLDHSYQPFTLTVQENDIRIGLPYIEENIQTGLTNLFREGGHALFEQGRSALLRSATSTSEIEAHKILWSELIGKSQVFWDAYYERFQHQAPKAFADVSSDEFYEGINAAKSSIIRKEANELTQPLHLQVRYELEKGIMEGKVPTRDLPGLWAEKVQKATGLTVPHDNAGILQEHHWATAQFGYSAAKAFAYVQAASWYEQMNDAMDTFNAAGAHEWLCKYVYDDEQFPSPGQYDGRAFTRYLENKYTSIYRI